MGFWSSFPATDFEEYLDGQGDVGGAVDGIFGLFALGMQEVQKSLLAADAGRWSQANQHLLMVLHRMLYAKTIDISNLKGTRTKLLATWMAPLT